MEGQSLVEKFRTLLARGAQELFEDNRDRMSCADSREGRELSRAGHTVESRMTDTDKRVDQFFERYATKLLARDEKAIAEMYAVPSLILFPGRSIVVGDSKQTEDFFASSWGQYEGIDAVEKRIAVMGEAPNSVWVDVTWSYGGQARERFCYQLIEGAKGYQIAVLTPMAL